MSGAHSAEGDLRETELATYRLRVSLHLMQIYRGPLFPTPAVQGRVMRRGAYGPVAIENIQNCRFQADEPPLISI